MAADAADATVASEDGTPAPSPTHATGHALQTGWRDAVLAVAAHYQLNASPEHIRVAAQWNERAPVEDQAREMARQAGLSLQLVQPRLADLNPWRLPVALQLDGGQVAVVTAASEGRLTLVMSGDGGATIFGLHTVERTLVTRQLRLIDARFIIAEQRVKLRAFQTEIEFAHAGGVITTFAAVGVDCVI